MVEERTGTEDDTSSELVKCPSCGFLNKPGAMLCLKCQTRLDPATAILTPTQEDVAGVPKWGSTRVEKKLFLHVRGSNEPIEIVLQEGEFVMGRKDASTNTLPEVELTKYGAGDKGVSRRHAKLSYQGTSLKIADLNSANYTYLNGYKLVANQARIVRDGDEIRLGHLTMTVQFGEDMITS